MKIAVHIGNGNIGINHLVVTKLIRTWASEKRDEGLTPMVYRMRPAKELAERIVLAIEAELNENRGGRR